MRGAFVSGRELQEGGEGTFLGGRDIFQKDFSARAQESQQNYVIRESFDWCQSPDSIVFWF